MKLLCRDQMLFRLGCCIDQLAGLRSAAGLVDLTISFPPTNNPKELAGRINRFFQNYVIRNNVVLAGCSLLTRLESTNNYHVHCLLAVNVDVAADFDWNAFDRYRCLQRGYVNNSTNKRLMALERRAYQRSLSTEIRQLTAQLSRGCSKMGFGRCWLLPVRKNVEALKYYYYSNVPLTRRMNESGIHFLRYWGVEPPAVNTFTCWTPRLVEKQQRYRRFGTAIGLPQQLNNNDAMQQLFGCRWKWELRRYIRKPPELWSDRMNRYAVDFIQPSVQQYINRMQYAAVHNYDHQPG